MKSNSALQTSIRFSNEAQKVWYAANVLKSALTNSPSVVVRPAVAAVIGKPAVLAQTAKPARPASAAIPGTANTTGFAFGALYLNSPNYLPSNPIPAIPAKPASAAVAYADAIPASPARQAIIAPAIVALKGWEDAISIVKSVNAVVVTFDLPVATNVGIVGSSLTVVGEITPSALQATAWIDDDGSDPNACGQVVLPDVATDTLEQFLYRNALLCNHTITSVTRIINGFALDCKRVVVSLAIDNNFDPLSGSLQLNKVYVG